MIATLIGGTGLTGSFLVRQFLADSAITKVISVSRKSLNISNAKLTEVLVSDLAELPSIESENRGEICFCCLGTTIKTAGSKEKPMDLLPTRAGDECLAALDRPAP